MSTQPDLPLPPAWAWALPTLVALGLGVLVVCNSGFMADDWMHLLAAMGEHPTAGPFDLYRWADGQPATVAAAQGTGLAPWWTDPELKIALFRPLSSALTQLDIAVFGTWATGHLLHSLVWLLAFVAVIQQVFRRALPPWVALVAAILVAVGPSQASALGWLAGRNVLVAGTFGGLGLWSLIAGRRAWAILAFAASLAAGEAGLAWIAYGAAWTLVGGKSGSQPAPTVGRRSVTLLALGLLVAAYLEVYVALDYGTAHSGAYVNPISEPVRWLVQAPGQALTSLVVLVVGVPAEPMFRRVDLHSLLVGIGVWGAIPVLAWLGFTMSHLDSARRRVVVALGLGCVGAVIPMLSGPLGPWSFVGPSVGASALLATLIVDAAPDHGGLLFTRRVGAFALVIGHGVGGVLTWLATAVALSTLQAQIAKDSAFFEADSRPLVLLTAPDPHMALYGAARQEVLGLAGPTSWTVLSLGECDHEWSMSGPRPSIPPTKPTPSQPVVRGRIPPAPGQAQLKIHGDLFRSRFVSLATTGTSWKDKSIELPLFKLTFSDYRPHLPQTLDLSFPWNIKEVRVVAWHQGGWVEISHLMGRKPTPLDWQRRPLW